MTHYVSFCDRIAPDTERIKKCLRPSASRLRRESTPRTRLEAAAGAVLVRAGSRLMTFRRSQSRFAGGFLGSGRPFAMAPDISLIPGFVRVLARDIDLPAIWEKAQSVTTIQEEIAAFRIAGKPLPLDQRFPRLREMPELKNLSERWRSLHGCDPETHECVSKLSCVYA